MSVLFLRSFKDSWTESHFITLKIEDHSIKHKISELRRAPCHSLFLQVRHKHIFGGIQTASIGKYEGNANVD